MLDFGVNAAEIRERLANPNTLGVGCLCAEWCGVCREYRPILSRLVGRHPDICFVWIDIETHADWLGDFEIETFPTILIEEATRTRFFGAVLPQWQIVEQLLAHLDTLPVIVNAPKLCAGMSDHSDHSTVN